MKKNEKSKTVIRRIYWDRVNGGTVTATIQINGGEELAFSRKCVKIQNIENTGEELLEILEKTYL